MKIAKISNENKLAHEVQ